MFVSTRFTDSWRGSFQEGKLHQRGAFKHPCESTCQNAAKCYTEWSRDNWLEQSSLGGVGSSWGFFVSFAGEEMDQNSSKLNYDRQFHINSYKFPRNSNTFSTTFHSIWILEAATTWLGAIHALLSVGNMSLLQRVVRLIEGAEIAVLVPESYLHFVPNRINRYSICVPDTEADCRSRWRVCSNTDANSSTTHVCISAGSCTCCRSPSDTSAVTRPLHPLHLSYQNQSQSSPCSWLPRCLFKIGKGHQVVLLALQTCLTQLTANQFLKHPEWVMKCVSSSNSL